MVGHLYVQGGTECSSAIRGSCGNDELNDVISSEAVILRFWVRALQGAIEERSRGLLWTWGGPSEIVMGETDESP